MKRNVFPVAVRVLAILAMVGSGAVAQNLNRMTLRGVINDFTPASTGGPWEVRGHWSLETRGKRGNGDCKANFSAALTMERSDQGVILNGHGDFNGENPMDRMAHTHHIAVTGEVTEIPGGIQVTGPVEITVNGGTPPPFGSDSTLTIQITGGNEIEFSNITLLFVRDAATHFGTLPLHGVVRSSR